MAEKEKMTKAPTKTNSIEPAAESNGAKAAKKSTSAAEPKPRTKATKAAAVTDQIQTAAASTGTTKLSAVPKRVTAKKEETAAAAPSREQIAQLAHRFWRERGGHHGGHEQDWFRAERELRGMAS